MNGEKQNCIIIHGCPGDEEKAMNSTTRTHDKHWIPWSKETLINLGVDVTTPFMPDPWEPDYEKFKKEFEKQDINENTTLVGHSCGCAFLVRWLGDSKKKINKLILVAPWKIADQNNKIKKAFYEYPIDETIRSRVDKIIMFTADDEEIEGKESLKIYHNALGGEIIELKGRGHYTMGDMGTTEFPELIEKIVSFDAHKALILPINPESRIFIQDRRGYKKPDWGYFGGGIKAGEIPLNAIIRESKEELDIDVKENELKYLGTSITLWNNHKIIRYIYLYPTKQKDFNVLEGKGGYWLTFNEMQEHLDIKDRFDDIATRIKKILSI